MSPDPWHPPTGWPAGWYGDPSGHPFVRYFDGRQWTPHTAAVGPVRAPAHRVLPLAVAVGAVLVLTVSLIVSRVLLEHLVQYDWPIVVFAAISVVTGYGPSVWWCWYATGRWGSGSRLDDLGLRLRWSDLGWGPVVWMAAIVVEIVVVLLVQGLHIPLVGNTEGIGELDLDRAYVIALLITAVVAAPLIEEMVFRALVLRGFLSRMGPIPAIAGQGALFGLAHVDPARGAGNIGLVLILGSVGVVFGGAAYLLRRIGPTVLAHAIFNGVVMAVVLSR
jgi:membrane protease YdiL (CAAX protease family)